MTLQVPKESTAVESNNEKPQPGEVSLHGRLVFMFAATLNLCHFPYLAIRLFQICIRDWENTGTPNEIISPNGPSAQRYSDLNDNNFLDWLASVWFIALEACCLVVGARKLLQNSGENALLSDWLLAWAQWTLFQLLFLALDFFAGLALNLQFYMPSWITMYTGALHLASLTLVSQVTTAQLENAPNPMCIATTAAMKMS